MSEKGHSGYVLLQWHENVLWLLNSKAKEFIVFLTT